MSGNKPAGLKVVELSIQGMTCAACAARVERKLNAMSGVSATVNYATEKASVTVPESVRVPLLTEEIEHAGYGAELVPRPALPGPEAGMTPGSVILAVG
jgi:Cu+-exporting ATPase